LSAEAAFARTNPFSAGSNARSRSDSIVRASGDCLADAASVHGDEAHGRLSLASAR
jgi:hypothetical protein